MKITSLVARILLGALFVFAGTNHLFNFFGKQPLPPGPAGAYLGAMVATGYMNVIGVCETLAGVLLLINCFLALALVVLAALIFNIFVVNLLMAPKALPVALFIVVLWVLAAYGARPALLPLLRAKVAE
jgi:putative oxidoreductase